MKILMMNDVCCKNFVSKLKCYKIEIKKWKRNEIFEGLHIQAHEFIINGYLIQISNFHFKFIFLAEGDVLD